MIERIGETVRTVRERAGRTLEDLATQSQVPISTLTALEQGQRGITTTQLDDVATALSLDSIALLNGREVPRGVPSVFLRHQQMQDFDDRDGPALDDALEQGRCLANLRAQLGEPALALQARTFKPHHRQRGAGDARAGQARAAPLGGGAVTYLLDTMIVSYFLQCHRGTT